MLPQFPSEAGLEDKHGDNTTSTAIESNLDPDGIQTQS